MKFLGMPLERIDKLISSSLRRAGISHQVEAALILHDCEAILEEMFGRDIFKDVRLFSVKNSVLTISCRDTHAAHEIRLREAEILKKISDKRGENQVKKIRFVAKDC